MQIRNMFNVILELASNDDYRQKVSNPEEFKVSSCLRRTGYPKPNMFISLAASV